MDHTSLPIYLFSLTSAAGVIHTPTLDVTYFQPAINFDQYEYLILTSKQAIAALEYYPLEDFINKPALCISKATAQAYKALGGKVLEEAKGYGDTLIEYVQKYPKSTRWLYLRAKEVASDFRDVLTHYGYKIDQAVLYQTQCSKAIQNVTLPTQAVLIFTSPSSVECFLQSHLFLPSYRVITIGKTTAKLIPSSIDVFIPEKPSIQSCIDLAKTLT